MYYGNNQNQRVSKILPTYMPT